MSTIKQSTTHATSERYEQGGDKAQRRRYKKLRKKATTILTGPLSGLTHPDDWNEFVAGRALFDTHNGTTGGDDDDDSRSATIGDPQIRWRSIKQERQAVQAEGAMQRDVLYFLLDKGRPRTIEDDAAAKAKSPLGAEAQSGQEKHRKREREECNTGKIPLPAWITVHNAVGISSVVLVEVHVASATLLQSLRQRLVDGNGHCSCLPVPTRWFNNEAPKSVSESLLYAAPPKPSKKRSKKRAAEARISNLPELYKALWSMTLTTEQRIQEGYPVAQCPVERFTTPSAGEDPTQISLADACAMTEPLRVKLSVKQSGGVAEEYFVASPPALSNGDDIQGQIYALDCEMVETTAGRALARFTLLQAREYNPNQKKVTCKVVWDTLVQPEATVTNYLTQWSGVSAESLKQGPTVGLAQIQAFLLCQLKPHDILVGHSLENDLQACRYIHRTCVDTAVLFRPDNRNFKYSLRNLTYQLLKRTIQKSSSAHCSEEDAQASLDLAVRRVAEGPSFCIADTRSRNQWATLARDRTTVAVGPNEWLQKHITNQSSGVHALSCEGIGDDTRKAMLAWVGSKRRADLVWGCFEVGKEEDVDAVAGFVSDLLLKISTGDTAVGIALQCNYEQAATMFQNRRTRQSGKTTLTWTNEEEIRFTELISESQQGTMLWFSAKN